MRLDAAIARNDANRLSLESLHRGGIAWRRVRQRVSLSERRRSGLERFALTPPVPSSTNHRSGRRLTRSPTLALSS
jgi:hypothetical protein